MTRRAFGFLMAVAVALIASWSVPARAWDGEWFYVCRLDPYGDNFLSLRTCPSSRCREIFRMGPGTLLVALDPYAPRGWRHVRIMRRQPGAGLRGWAFRRYLCPAEPPYR